MLGNPNMGVGEYLTLWVILGVIALAALGWLFGAAFGGVLVFVIIGVLIAILAYAVLSRMWRFLLHGSISAGGSGGAE